MMLLQSLMLSLPSPAGEICNIIEMRAVEKSLFYSTIFMQ